MQVIVKPTTACNGNCVYCSAPDAGGGRLDEDRLGPFFRPFAGWLRSDSSRTLCFVWHGGEPLLMGPDYYRRVMLEQETAFGDDVARVRNHVQTNATLVTDEWVDVLQRFAPSGVGTSFDVIDGVRGLQSGEDLTERWLPAVDRLRAAGIPVGVLYVVHRHSLDQAASLYHYFRNLAPRSGLRFNPLYREGRAADDQQADLGITPEEFAAFLLEVAELWWQDGERTPVLPLSEWARAWRGETERLCCDSSGRCHETHLGIDAAGRAFTCGRFSDRHDPSLVLGNVFEDDLDAILAHPLRQRMAGRSPALRTTACRACPYWALCHGGCPMMAQLYHGDRMRETWFCEARKQVYGWFERRLGPPPRDLEAPGGDGSEDWL